VLQVTHHRGPRLGALAVAVLDGQQLLDAVLAHTDHDEQAEPVVLTQAHADMHAVDEQVRVAMEAQRPRPEALVLALPVLAQPTDRRRRQAGGVLAEQLLQGRPEVAGRQAAQEKHRQHVVDLRRAARVGGQDLRAEPLALPRLLIETLVVDPGRPDRHGARADRHVPLAGTAVAHHQSLAVLVDLLDERRNVLVDLGLQGRRDHAPPPSRARSSNVTTISSFSPTGSLRTSFMACLPAGHTGIGLHQPGRYAAFLLRPIHNIWV